MTSTQMKAWWRGWIGGALAMAIIVAALQPYFPQIAARARLTEITGPNWSLWMNLPSVFQLHILSAVVALLIGGVILLRPKGRGLHKALGWSWVVAMGTTAVSSLFMTGLNGSFYSLVHLLSGWTIVGLPMAIFAVRRRKVETHRRAMTGMFVGGLLIAGGLTFIPGRFMLEFFFG